jgi:hypothetical protein
MQTAQISQFECAKTRFEVEIRLPAGPPRFNSLVAARISLARVWEPLLERSGRLVKQSSKRSLAARPRGGKVRSPQILLALRCEP